MGRRAVEPPGNELLGNGLIVLARYPEPGRVKTRLAATIGPQAAADLYRRFLTDVARRLGSDSRWRFFWAYEPAGSRFVEEIAPGSEAFPQPAGDLGARMAAAMAEGFARGCARIVLIGSDLPHLPAERIAAAFDCLAAGADLVLGPADDGGYYLIGSRAVPPVFSGMVWSEPDVLERTLANGRAAGLRVELLAATFDLDSVADLERLLADPVAGEIPETCRAIERVLGRSDPTGVP